MAPVSSVQELPSPTYEFSELASTDRLRELILYISERCQDDPDFGAVKLNKVLFFSDFLSFAFHGEAITGVEYMKLPQGPAPKRLVPIREAMRAADEIAIVPRPQYDYTQKRIVPLRQPNLDIFSARDISVIDQVIDALCGRNAAEVSAISHDRAWRIPVDKGSIPYEAVFLSDEGITDYDITRAAELIREHGWDVANT